ncbi:GTP-binding protein Rhes-like protein [Dinothrombium tinctorium]|uniref:GTP-binding protein Rhes-like protein n=1 Tax=Dinothrombium tinctorium TaxID=1965070 RepID=A0A3S3QEQ5_9ACAR|nr:GTP-binding protein Rhes-like protein [Dinothrombium tinctorium]
MPSAISFISWSDTKYRMQARVVVLGASRVGKTAIIKQFVENSFPEHHDATVEEWYSTEFDMGNNGTLTLNILDTAGTGFPEMRRMEIKNFEAFILVFDVNDYDSFEEVRCLRERIIEAKRKPATTTNADISEVNYPPIVIVGNKNDSPSKRVVSKELAETISTIDWENGYVDASAKEDVNVCEVFRELSIQAKFPPFVTRAIKKENVRRKSLPAYPTSPKIKTSTSPKRNSCALS